MSKYWYEITGDYKDNLKIKKRDIVIHDGNLIGLLSYTNDNLELKLNYGTVIYHPCELKRIDNIIMTVPIKEYLYKSDYLYIPLVFETEEYEQFIDISYIDRELLDNIHQVNKQDIYNLLMMRFKSECCILESLSFKDIVDNIVACSEETDKVIAHIHSSLNNEIVNIRTLDKNDLKNITLYVDFSDKLYEWSPISKVDENYYFHLIDKYVIGIK